MIPRSVLAAMLLAGAPAAGACGRDAAATPRPVARASGAAAPARGCDSARAAGVALDSLARLAPFRSAVVRFERDTAGVRIVTRPEPHAGVVDGMAVVRVGRDCRVASLAPTDSA